VVLLERIERALDWSAFEGLLSPVHASKRGAPGWPPLVMFKIVLLQQWHELSDPGAEEAVRDRLSFRRFCGLSLDTETPDHASIWRFRQTIDKLGLSSALLAETNRQLDALGLMVKRGTLVDATLIAAAVKARPLRQRRDQPARPGRADHDEAQEGVLWLQGAFGGGRGERACAAGRNDFGQRPRFLSGGRR